LDLAIQGSAWGQTNILNNGGFETGLMCFTEWMWSNTGVDFAGNYQFLLSTDAHSGKYSFKINCAGSDCLKAAITSEVIPTPANQSYILSMYAKCPLRTTAYTYIPNMAKGDVSTGIDCTGAWAPYQVAFQTGPTAGYMTFGIYLYGAPWLEVDDVRLTYGDKTVPQTPVLHPGSRKVSVSGQTVLVDGAPFLSLGFFDVKYRDLEQVAATGANTINGFSNNAANCFNTGQKSYLDTVYELGMSFVPDSATTARLSSADVMPKAVQTFAPHLANIGWFLADEPDLKAGNWEFIQPETFVAEANAARTQTSLPMMADFQTATYGPASGVAPYNGSADIWMAEPYGPAFTTSVYAINLFNSIQPRPIWLAQNNIDPSLIVPKAYWAVIAGATGIHYFTWELFKADPNKLAAAQQVFTELKGLKNAVFGQKIDALVTAPAGIGSMSRFDPGTGMAYILSANSSSDTVQAKFQVQGLAAGQQINVLYENRSIKAGAGTFSDTFAGTCRHVYAMQSATTSLKVNLAAKSGPASSRDWQIQVSNTGIGPANSAQITGVALTQTAGTKCSSQFAADAFPVSVGNISPAANATADVLINFTGCDDTSKFTARITVATNSGATAAKVTRYNEGI
jgi:hypothetical protein